MLLQYPTVHYRLLRWYLFIKDIFFLCCIKLVGERKTDQAASTVTPKRVLLRNPAALGDIFYTLRLAAALKRNHKNLEIGLLVGSWTKQLVQLSPDIDYIHFEDHWLLPRGNKGLLVRVWDWFKARPHVVQKIRAKHYDIAFDLFYRFPSGAFLFWQAQIPRRIGYDSNGGTCLLTQSVHYELLRQHNVEYQAALLKAAGFSSDGLETIIPDFLFERDDEDVLACCHLTKQEYIVLHIGTSAPTREWSRERWIALAQFLEDKGLQLCFTGKGKREAQLITYVTRHLKGKFCSLCDGLDIAELFQVIRNARMLIGVESFAGHIAALYQVPQVSIMHGASNQYHWQPYHNANSKVIRRALDCAPCYAPRNCQNGNVCMDISLEDVIEAVESVLRNEAAR